MRKALVFSLVFLLFCSVALAAQQDSSIAECEIQHWAGSIAVYEGDCDDADLKARLITTGRLLDRVGGSDEDFDNLVRSVCDEIVRNELGGPVVYAISCPGGTGSHNYVIQASARVHRHTSTATCTTYTNKYYVCTYCGDDYVQNKTNLATHTYLSTTCKNWNPPL